jgi:hypothetical protein
MDCLENFDGWADFHDEEKLRKIIRGLKLRPLDEPGDVDSPLLRSQIDEQFLRAMISARENRDITPQSDATNVSNKLKADSKLSSGLPLHPKVSAIILSNIRRFIKSNLLHQKNAKVTTRAAKQQSHSMYASQRAMTNKSQSSFGDGSRSSHGASCGYPTGRYWGNGWTPNFAVCDESNSVHSTLSGDTQACGYPPAHYDPYLYGFYSVPYYPPHYQEQFVSHYYHGGYVTGYNMCINQEHSIKSIPAPNNSHHAQGGSPVPPRTPSKASPDLLEQNELSAQYVDSCTNYGSTYWGHMENQMRQTLANAGIITPHKCAPASPPDREPRCEVENVTPKREQDRESQQVEMNAKPLLLNHSGFYNPYNFTCNHESVPPSPATQFMMPPQADARSAAYYANYPQGGQYGFSPRRSTIRRKNKRLSPSPKQSEKLASKIQHDDISRSKLNTESDSENTSATVTETESISAS